MMIKLASKILYWTFSVIISTIIIISCVNAGEYFCKKNFLLPNMILIIFSVVIFLLLIVLVKKNKIKKFNIWLCSAMLLIVQIFIANYIFFKTGWDPSALLDNAQYIVEGNLDKLNNYYFSIYPNNKFLLFIFVQFFKVASLFNVTNPNVVIFVIIFFQCVLTILTGILLYNVVKDVTNSNRAGVLAWLLFAALIGLSGWIIIPYSDMWGLIFPILIVYMYQKTIKDNYSLKSLALLSAISIMGFKIKPTIIIVFISIIVFEALRLINNYIKKGINPNYRKAIVIAASLLISTSLCNMAISTLPFDNNKNKEFTPIHMLMMGLNQQTNGGYSENDVQFTNTLVNTENKESLQFEVIKMRIKNYGFNGLVKHFKKKMLTVFNDGTFAWGLEGNFYKEVFETESRISSILKNVYYDDGSTHMYLELFQQAIWVFLLLSSVLIVFQKQNKVTDVIILTLIGFIVFELLFEVRSRYLIVFLPLFITISSVCIYNSSKILTKKSIKKL